MESKKKRHPLGVFLDAANTVLDRTSGRWLESSPTLRPSMMRVKGSELVGVEIGVAEGRNSERMLRQMPIKKIFLIDPYIAHFQHPIAPTAHRKVALKRLRKFRDRIVIVDRKAEDKGVADSIPNELDFVYIDGDHSYKMVTRDIEIYFPKVRKGGVIGGHDINMISVARAVDDFARKKRLKPHTERMDWWIVK